MENIMSDGSSVPLPLQDHSAIATMEQEKCDHFSLYVPTLSIE